MNEVSSWVVEAERARLTDEERRTIDAHLRRIGIDRETYLPYIRRQVVDLDAGRAAVRDDERQDRETSAA